MAPSASPDDPLFQLRENGPPAPAAKQQDDRPRVFSYMEPDDLGGSAALRWPNPGWPESADRIGEITRGEPGHVDVLSSGPE